MIGQVLQNWISKIWLKESYLDILFHILFSPYLAYKLPICKIVADLTCPIKSYKEIKLIAINVTFPAGRDIYAMWLV